ncbi:MAG: inorganic phosphate transporter [Bacteroidetes bacterium]|nr:inorganic phosphate transporter [Bacteroidota bacterium]
MTLVIVIIILALIFDYINGFHDAANSIATVVSTKVLTPFQAVLWAALFNMAAYWIFKDHAVANTISKTVSKEFITLPVILSGLIAAIIWNLLTWWYGIPSSSSHTLIGGFAGAALTHAIMQNGWGIAWSKVVESNIIITIILFIFLAPIIGMIISMFITIVMVMKNVWLRIAIIAISTLLTFFLFNNFEQANQLKNVKKFLKIDKHEKEEGIAANQLKINPNDTIALAALKKAQTKLEHTMPAYNRVKVLLKKYDKLGSDSIAKTVYNEGLLKEIEVSRLKDEVRNANNFLVHEAMSVENDSIASIFKNEKAITEKYQEPLARFINKEISVDSTITLLDNIYPINIKNYESVKHKLTNYDIEHSLSNEISRADNGMIAWAMVYAAIFFSLVFLYVEKIRTPNAYRISKMFKRLQLFTSAAFSIGHGGNDAQKVMGIIGAALIASGQIQDFASLPLWVPLACYAAIGLGTLSGGWKIVKTMGTKITKVTPLEGVAAETAGAFTLFFTGQMGIPVSTTHTITGSIIGVGATKRLSAVRWGVTINLIWAWILTIPISALLAALAYFIVHLLL